MKNKVTLPDWFDNFVEEEGKKWAEDVQSFIDSGELDKEMTEAYKQDNK